jgi:hypothetical protein
VVPVVYAAVGELESTSPRPTRPLEYPSIPYATLSNHAKHVAPQFSVFYCEWKFEAGTSKAPATCPYLLFELFADTRTTSCRSYHGYFRSG